MFSWGSGSEGRLGHGDIRDHRKPTEIAALRDRHVTTVEAGTVYSCALTGTAPLSRGC